MELSIKNLTKIYQGYKYGLLDFTLELKPGIIGLLGPNGAGKTTLMRILATLLKPTKGQVFWNGVDTIHKPNVIRQILGYLPQDFGVYPNLNAVEFLEYLAAVKGQSGRKTRGRIIALLEELNLTHAARKSIGTYSGGMRQRIGIAQALLNDPQLLVLDEPFVGLDPAERIRFRNLLSHLSGQRIILFSSHVVSDVEAIAGMIVIMKNGSLLEYERPHHILNTIEGKVFEKKISNDAFNSFKSKHLISNSLRQTDDSWLVRYIRDDTGGTAEPKENPVKPTLEDAYLWYTSQHDDKKRER
jgi:ABC-type multidrug transport system ATPase subunit